MAGVMAAACRMHGQTTNSPGVVGLPRPATAPSPIPVLKSETNNLIVGGAVIDYKSIVTPTTNGYWDTSRLYVRNLTTAKNAANETVDISSYNTVWLLSATTPIRKFTNSAGGKVFWATNDAALGGSGWAFYTNYDDTADTFIANTVGLGTNGDAVATTVWIDAQGNPITDNVITFGTNYVITLPQRALALAANALSNNQAGASLPNLSNSFVQISETRGTTNAPITIYSTNSINNTTKHITVVQNNMVATSTDGAFAGLYPGCQITFGNEQLVITKVLSANAACVLQENLGYTSPPSIAQTASTSWRINFPLMRWTDYTGSFYNVGGYLDDNGMPWYNALSDQGIVYFIDPTSASVMTVGVSAPSSITGLSSTNGEMLFGVSFQPTNGNYINGGQRTFILGVHGSAPGESLVVADNGNIAVSADFTNRHGNANSFGLAIAGKTNALSGWPTAPTGRGGYAIVNSNATVYILTSTPNSLTWAATNKLAGP